MPLPKIDIDVLHPIIMEIAGPQADPHWVENEMTRLTLEQPVIARYLGTQDSEIAKLVGLLVYRFVESQVDADDLTNLIGE